MASEGARLILAEYARRIRATHPEPLIVSGWVRLGETSLLESYRWVRCERVQGEDEEESYRVSLTRLGVREVRAMP